MIALQSNLFSALDDSEMACGEAVEVGRVLTTAALLNHKMFWKTSLVTGEWSYMCNAGWQSRSEAVAGDSHESSSVGGGGAVQRRVGKIGTLKRDFGACRGYGEDSIR